MSLSEVSIEWVLSLILNLAASLLHALAQTSGASTAVLLSQQEAQALRRLLVELSILLEKFSPPIGDSGGGLPDKTIGEPQQERLPGF